MAYSFPGPEQHKDSKVKKLLSQMRSSPDPSLLEHFESQCELVQTVRREVLGESNGLFDVLPNGMHDGGYECGHVDSTGDECGRVDSNYKITSFLFEHDLEYLSFLDKLFAVVILPLQKNHRQSTVHASSSPMTLFDRKVVVLTGGSASMILYPIINSLIRWTRMPPLLTKESDQGSSSGGHQAGMRKMARRRSRLGSLLTRINLSAPVIISALNQMSIDGTSQQQHGEKDEHLVTKSSDLVDSSQVEDDIHCTGTPRMLGCVARDERGHVHLLTVPDGILMVSIKRVIF